MMYFLRQVGLGSLYRPNAQAVQVPEYRGNYHVINAKLLKVAHQKILPVQAYTINDVDDMRRLLDAGVDGLITDYPDSLIGLLKQ